MAIPTYITVRDYIVIDRGGGEQPLPAGSFVKPIELTYLPVHIKESKDYKYFNKEIDVFCYTHYGLVLLPLKLIRKVHD